MELLEALIEFKRYNAIEFFKPYPYQLKMYEAGKDHMSRFACFSNRSGKTFSGCRELTYHLTGRYPSWWTGYRFNKGPLKTWAIGITGETTRKVLQLELVGTIDVRHTDLIGTGAIRKDDIVKGLLEKDGAFAKVVYVKHYDSDGNYDGNSTLEFRSTQQGHMALAGAAVDFILLDEEDEHDSLSIYSQSLTRLATTNGRLLITATPEAGMSPLIQKFYDTPELWIEHIGWNDVPHLTEEIKKELLAGIPDFEIPMRTQGLPSRGSGAVFQVPDEDISVEPFTIPLDWKIVAGVDFGRSKDPSVIVYAAKDPNTDTIYLFSEDYLDKDRSPENMANTILSSDYPNIPVIIPHDGNSVSTDGGSETRAVIMRNTGCNVPMVTFSNPQEVQNQISSIHKKHNGIEGGLIWMAHKMKTGKLKVFSNLNKFFKEKSSYFYIERGGKVMPRDKDNHVIDASRIAVLSVDRYGVPSGQCITDFDDFNNGFDPTPLLVRR